MKKKNFPARLFAHKTRSAGRGTGIVGNPAVIPPRQAVCRSDAPPYLGAYGSAGCEPRPRPRLTIVASTTRASQRVIYCVGVGKSGRVPQLCFQIFLCCVRLLASQLLGSIYPLISTCNKLQSAGPQQVAEVHVLEEYATQKEICLMISQF